MSALEMSVERLKRRCLELEAELVKARREVEVVNLRVESATKMVKTLHEEIGRLLRVTP